GVIEKLSKNGTGKRKKTTLRRMTPKLFMQCAPSSLLRSHRPIDLSVALSAVFLKNRIIADVRSASSDDCFGCSKSGAGPDGRRRRMAVLAAPAPLPWPTPAA